MKEKREYQERAISFLAARRRALLQSPAGSGKTFILSSAIARVSRPFDRVGVLVGTIEQKAQFQCAIAEAGIDASVSITIACAASNPDFSDCDVVVVDECHHSSAATWFNCIMGATGIVFGCSATPFCGIWEKDNSIKALFGYPENFLKIDRNEVLDGGSITRGTVTLHDLDEEGEFDEAIEARSHMEIEKRFRLDRRTPRDIHAQRVRSQFTNEAVIANSKRNAKVIQLASECTESTLVLVRSINHGQDLARGISGSVVVFSRMGAKKRRAAIDGFRDGSIRVLIATSLADEGLDVPRASVLIYVAGGRSGRLTEQRSGRVLRKFEGKSLGMIHDFVDKGASMAFNHARIRIRTYRKLGYTIKK